ncbi:serine protease [Flavobacterium pectinovorum]|uniref:S1 family peptidase n=1 Tax=Flavobacterium pectinovorum TaxID=29533 RepID=UPI001FAB39F5|nr:serine protease [Flavobacterium pectinovorum]MCI9844602.1 trypsin-like peptidase domain-containing protein [Flavobacterium pectinovorum]
MSIRLTILFSLCVSSYSVSAQNQENQTIDIVLNQEVMSAAFPKVTALKQQGSFLSQEDGKVQLEKSIGKKIALGKNKSLATNLSAPEIYQKMLPSTIVLASDRLRGSGYLISSDGICVTNYHVIQMYTDPESKNSGLSALTHDNEVYMVTEILASSPENDLAIIKIDTRGKKLPALPLGDYLPEGNKVFVLGHPSHVMYYFSEGIVAKNFIRNPKLLSPKEECFMAVTADYGIGCSGAPVVDQKGNIVATVSAAMALYQNPNTLNNPQMVLRNTIPVIALKQLIDFK